MINCGPRCDVLYFFAHRVPQFIIKFHKFSIKLCTLRFLAAQARWKPGTGYEILAPGYKFCGWQFETPGYTRNLGGLRGLSYQSYTCHIFFLVSSNCHIQNGVQVIIGLKFKIRNVFSVIMLRHIIIYKKSLRIK